MKHLFKMNIATVLILIVVAFVNPFVALMGTFPLGMIQLILSLAVLLGRKNKMLNRYATLHLLLGIIATIMIFSRVNVFTGIGICMAVCLCFFSLFLTQYNDNL